MFEMEQTKYLKCLPAIISPLTQDTCYTEVCITCCYAMDICKLWPKIICLCFRLDNGNFKNHFFSFCLIVQSFPRLSAWAALSTALTKVRSESGQIYAPCPGPCSVLCISPTIKTGAKVQKWVAWLFRLFGVYGVFQYLKSVICRSRPVCENMEPGLGKQTLSHRG